MQGCFGTDQSGSDSGRYDAGFHTDTGFHADAGFPVNAGNYADTWNSVDTGLNINPDSRTDDQHPGNAFRFRKHSQLRLQRSLLAVIRFLPK